MIAGRRLPVFGPADYVTSVRAAVALAVTALVPLGFTGPPNRVWIVALSTAALVLDRVDGGVARRTGTASEFGARFDMEVDAFLVLVLSVAVAGELGGWVVAIGLARYVLLIATWFAPWLRQPVAPRHWCKVVAVVQGVVLITAVSRALPLPLTTVLVLAALALLIESFGREIAWKWRDTRACQAEHTRPVERTLR